MNTDGKGIIYQVDRNDIPLQDQDPELYGLILKERERQRTGIELIASENFTTRAVMECLGSCLTNKYSEGQSGGRYYGGNEWIDKIEDLCKARALQTFGVSGGDWDVNVQPYSGSPANFAVYTALLQPHDRVMGLGLPHGGHLTHGYYTAKKKISATSIYFESFPYGVSEQTGLIDFDQLKKDALIYRPRMIIAGASAYPRVIDFQKFREICDEVGAFLMIDMAHISGLVATKLHTIGNEAWETNPGNPFAYAHVITSTTHKSLAGPRAGIIFYKMGDFDDEKKLQPVKHPLNGTVFNIKEAIDMAVFPGLQGGPHNHQIAGLASQLKEAQEPHFVEYSQNVIENNKALAANLIKNGFTLCTGGTDNHLILWDLRPLGLTGSKFEKVAEAAHISLNRNSVPGDKSALSPGGVRIGSPAMTSRNCTPEDFEKIGEFLKRCVDICLKIQETHGRKLVDFERGIAGNEEIAALNAEVQTWAGPKHFPAQTTAAFGSA